MDHELLLKAAMTVLVVLGIAGGLFALAMLREEDPDSHAPQIILLVVLAMMAMAVYVMLTPIEAWSRDIDGHYAAQNPELHAWFEKLRAKGGALCCSDADGRAIDDPDWEIVAGASPHYRVKIEGGWLDVEDKAVVIEPNRAGKAMVWPYYEDGRVIFIRCFMPGSMM